MYQIKKNLSEKHNIMNIESVSKEQKDNTVLPLVVDSANKNRKCYNCKYRTEAFKIGKLTYYHCMSPTYTKQYNEGVYISPWETLRVFSDSCDEHDFKTRKNI